MAHVKIALAAASVWLAVIGALMALITHLDIAALSAISLQLAQRADKTPGDKLLGLLPGFCSTHIR